MLLLPRLESLLLFGILSLVGCTPELPTGAENHLLQACVFRSQPSRDILVQAKVPPHVRDSLIIILQERQKQKNHSIALTPPHDTIWWLGIHTPIIQKDSLYPLIIYLHGGINTTRSDKGRASFMMMDFLYDSLPLFVASPSGNRFARWWDKKGVERILLTVRYMTLLYPIDPDRIILAGVSDGGTATFAIAQLEHHPFTDFWAISGFPPLLPQLGVNLQKEKLRQSPLYMINSGKDRLYPAKKIRHFARQLKEFGLPIEFSYYPQEEHGFAYKNQEYIKLKKRMQTPPHPHQTKSLAPTAIKLFFDNLDSTHFIHTPQRSSL